MEIIRDERRIARLKRVGAYLNFLGMGVLIAGLVLPLIIKDTRIIVFQFLAIPGGWLLAQAGIYLTHRYFRDPRPDEVLDEALRKVARDGRMYHYVLPAPHVLLTPSGPIVFTLKYQVARVYYADGKWKQSGMSLVRRFFGQEGLGNPERDAQRDLQKLVGFLEKEVQELDEVPVGVMLVFTSKGVDLDAGDSPIPAYHYTKLKGVFKRTTQGPPLPEESYRLLQAAFDEKAGDLVEDE